MEVSMPLYTIGIKCKPANQKEKVRTHLAIEVLLNLIIGESSKLYQDLYKQGILISIPEFEYEFTDEYAHILLIGTTNNPEKLYRSLKNKIREMKESGLNDQDIQRIKKMIYGEYVKSFNDVSDIARMFLADFMKGINSFDYIEELESVDKDYIKRIFDENFKEEKMVISVVK